MEETHLLVDKDLLKSNNRLKIKFLVQKNECGIFFDRFITSDAKHVFSSFKEAIAASTMVNFSEMEPYFSETPSNLYNVFEQNVYLKNEKIYRLETAITEISGYLPVYEQKPSSDITGCLVSKYTGVLRNSFYSKKIRPLVVVNLSNGAQEIGSVYLSVSTGEHFVVRRRLFKDPLDLEENVNLSQNQKKEIGLYLKKNHFVFSYERFRLWDAQILDFLNQISGNSCIFIKEKSSNEEYQFISNLFKQNDYQFESIGLIVLENQLNSNFIGLEIGQINNKISMISDTNGSKNVEQIASNNNQKENDYNLQSFDFVKDLKGDDLYYLFRYKILKRDSLINCLHMQKFLGQKECEVNQKEKKMKSLMNLEDFVTKTKFNHFSKQKKKNLKKTYSNENKENFHKFNNNLKSKTRKPFGTLTFNGNKKHIEYSVKETKRRNSEVITNEHSPIKISKNSSLVQQKAAKQDYVLMGEFSIIVFN